MKRHILKNIFKTCIAAAFALSLAGCSFLSVDSDDDSDSGSVTQPVEKAAGTGSTVVRIGVPDYEKFASRAVSSARVIAPQTKYARLGYSTNGSDFTYLEAVELSSENATTGEGTDLITVYSLTFSGIPSGTYKAGYLKIQLLGSSADSSAVSEGTNSAEVTVSSAKDAPASFFTVPASVSVSTTGSLSAGEMVFLSKEVAANTVSTLTVTIGDNDTAYPIVALFNSDGSFEKATTLSADEKTVKIDNGGKTESSSYFIGLYTKDTAISSYTAEWKDETYFTKFDAADVSYTTTDVSASNGSWTLTGASSSKPAMDWIESHTTYDYDKDAGTGYAWEREFYFNGTILKLKVGAGKTVVLRIDGGKSTPLGNYDSNIQPATLTITGTETKEWKPYVADSTYYVEVKGDTDGYVSIAGDAYIYGITLADKVIDLSQTTRSETGYSVPSYPLSSSSVTLINKEDQVNLYECEDNSFTFEAKASLSGTKRINTASVDGTIATAGESSKLDFPDTVISYVWYKDDQEINGETSSTYTATSAGTYKVEVTVELDGKRFSGFKFDSCNVTNIDTNYAVTYYPSEISSDEIALMKDYNGNSFTLPNDSSYAYLYEGTYSIWNGKGSIVTETEGVRLSNSRIYICKNLTGSSTTSAPAVGDTVSSLKNYIKVTAPSSSENSVTLDGYYYVSSSKSVSEVPFWIVITDSKGKVLSVKQVSKQLTKDNYGTYSCLESRPFTFDLNIEAKSDICIGIMYDEETLSRSYFSISSVFIGKNVAISFNKNSDDATISTTPKDVIVGETSSLPTAGNLRLRREGYAFAGWAESADATEVKYADGAEIFVTEATTLYAVWTKENAMLSFDKNSDDATIGTTSKNVKVSEEVQLPTARTLGLIRDGYAFAGWAKSADATEAEYADGAEISVADDTTLYAVWKKYVAITFDKNDKDAKIDAEPQSAAPGSTVLLTEAKWLKLSRPDYVFAGWAKSADATEAEYADGAEISVTEDTTLYAVWKGAVFFTEFTATGLRKEYAPDTTTEEVKVYGSYDAKDGSWSVDSAVQVKSFTGKTFDYEAGTGYSYTDRFCFNSKNEERGIKLRIGVGKTKILRIDGGSNVDLKSSDAGNKGIIDISIKGAETKTWSPKVRYSTYYVEVTGDEDGYVSITTRDTTDKSGQIYGIYVVDSLVDISSEKQVYTSVSYDLPSLSLNEAADLNGQDSVALTVNVNSTPKRTTTTKTISVDGLGDVSNDIVEEELSDLQWSYQWYKSGNKIKGATSETYSASALATYSVKVSYKYTDENGKTQSKSATKECVVTDSKASDVVVTFKKNSKNASIASENYQTVKSGATVALTKSKDLSLSNAGYAFMGWATSADGKVSYVDGANILFYENTTLYAVWVAKSSGELVGYPNASGEWTQAENKLLADVTDSAGNTILEFAAMNNLVGNSYGSKGKDIDGDSVDYFKYMKTDGGTSNSRYIKITVPEGKTADVFCAFRTGSDGSTRSVGIGTKSANNSFDVVAKVSSSSTGYLSYLSNDFALLAGTYYVNVDGNIEFSAIQVRLYSEE